MNTFTLPFAHLMNSDQQMRCAGDLQKKKEKVALGYFLSMAQQH